MPDLRDALIPLLESSSHLLESKKGEDASAASNLQSLLQERLQNYYSHEGIEPTVSISSLQGAQLATAKEALSALERIEKVLLLDDTTDATQKPLLGTRDLAQIRTLISLVFKWGTEPLLKSMNDTWKVDEKGKGRRIIEADVEDESYATVSNIVTRVMTILFPQGVKGNMSPTVISSTLTNRHLVDILRCSIPLGWLPPSLSTPAMPTIDHLRPFTMRLLSTLSPAMLISALGSILSDGHNLPMHVRKAASSFITQQLLRPGGVLGLCESVFGEEETYGDAVKLEKLEQISRTLVSVPTKMAPQEYFGVTVPRIIQLLSERVPASYRKIAAFTLSQMLGSQKTFQYQDVAAPFVYSTLHLPFLRLPTPEDKPQALPSTALSNLLILIANCDPSPELISNLLSPIIAPLYSLFFYLSSQKTTDPRLKESVQGLLVTWGKIVDPSRAVDLLWALIQEGQEQYWSASLDGTIRLIPEPQETRPLDLLTPDDLKQAEEQNSLDANIFDLYPDPGHLVRFLKLLDRGDVVSELFIKVLDAYQQSKTSGGDPMKSLHYLQIFMQMQLQLLGASSSSILRKPDQLLSFIKQVLESASVSEKETPTSPVNRLDINAGDKDSDDEDEYDSDNDDPTSEVIKPDDEMVETAINLLLSVLEMHETLSARTAPILNDIFSLLEPITYRESSALRPIAREARMVITARSASTSTITPGKTRDAEEESAQEIYQKSLKLLQDPILPVRAHGLLLLRQLVTPKPKSAGKSTTVTDSALVPAILSIFLQSIQDEDSYIFLNGVQGLAAMVDGFGKDVLRGLVKDYSGGLETMPADSMSQQDLDVRIRIGEALSTVIVRCGPTLGKFGDILIPALFSVFRFRGIPVTLRTSSLSLLADALGAYPLVMLPYTEDLAQGMIDLLQVESRPTPLMPKAKEALKSEEETKPQDATGDESILEEVEKQAGDNDHLTANSKYPPLRRAALHLLALLIRSSAQAIEDGHQIMPFSVAFVKRAHLTLGYISGTDDDSVVRVMAREVNEELSSFESYLVGL
ncbi:hypothetical protein DFP72DRAFT_876446 [Ephemerocybe angulata]|uniref:RNA polymerase II assembly factor Rtp1 C-terminal domain-containing protein n=1 Tax=Ephemerocybe angulata TaxID=980116 RepID=A0A8H6IBU1_9AGAR|nr:hypothetical protein DFP72DRAFT_876446 [Tulosesus angulatus]